MAKKSKTQRAKASAARAARKEQVREAESAQVEAKDVAEADAAATEAPKRKLFRKADKVEAPAADKQEKGKIEKKTEKAEEKPVKKKRRFGFLKDVRSEMKRVTWPSKQDVLRWSVVVVAALLFFGVYVTVLDNVIITPLLVAISGLGV